MNANRATEDNPYVIDLMEEAPEVVAAFSKKNKRALQALQQQQLADEQTEVIQAVEGGNIETEQQEEHSEETIRSFYEQLTQQHAYAQAQAQAHAHSTQHEDIDWSEFGGDQQQQQQPQYHPDMPYGPNLPYGPHYPGDEQYGPVAAPPGLSDFVADGGAPVGAIDYEEPFMVAPMPPVVPPPNAADFAAADADADDEQVRVCAHVRVCVCVRMCVCVCVCARMCV